MEKLEIEIDNKTYPCRLTMGAYLRYKRETGKDFAEESKVDNVNVCTLMWCAAVSSSKHDNKDFPLSLEEFADSITPATAGLWFAKAMEGAAKDTQDAAEEKKRQESQNS